MTQVESTGSLARPTGRPEEVPTYEFCPSLTRVTTSVSKFFQHVCSLF